MEKSANKKWRESGTTLSFKEWVDRENKKNEAETSNFIPFSGFEPIQVDTSSIDASMKQAQADLKAASGYKTQADSNTIFGLDKNILIFSGVLIGFSVGMYFYVKLKKK